MGIQGNGFVFISQNNNIVILDINDFTSKKLYIDFKDDYLNEYRVKDKVNYYYWFEITELKTAEVLLILSLI